MVCNYWLTGYGVGGSIASEVAGKLIEESKEVYAYTLGAFNTEEYKKDTYTEIKNIRNEDDFFIKYITGSKKGQSYGKSIYEDLMWEYRDLTGNSNYEGNYIFTNYLLYVYDKTQFASINNISDADRILTNYFRTFNEITNQNDITNYTDLVALLNEWKRGNEQAHSMKSYYVLAKSLTGFDLLDGDGERQEHYKTIPLALIDAYKGREDQEITNGVNFELLNVIKDLGVWYVNHIPTYQNKDIPPNATEPAKEYYSHRNEYPVDNMGNRLTDDNRETVVIGIGNKKGFFYEPFKDMVTTYRYDEVSGRNYYKRYLGNDCTGFSQGVIYTLSNGDRGQTGDVNTASDGLFNHNASADKLVQGYDYTDKAMLNLGWEKYYLDGNIWKQKRLYNGEVQIRTLKEAFGYEMNDAGVNFLEPGDLLCNKEHAEFYVGYIWAHRIVDGIQPIYYPKELVRLSDLTPRYEEYREYIDENNGNDLRNDSAYSTFGWGDVQNEVPKSKYSFKYNKNGFVRYGGDGVDKHKYTVIWRKN